LIALLAFLAVANAVVYTPRHAGVPLATQFDEYTQFWNKTYETVAEHRARYLNFQANAEKIAQLNAKSRARGYGASYGFTKFSDWSAREFKKLLGFKRSPNRPVVAAQEKRNVEQSAPSQPIDWVAKGMTTAVKNQEQCGSCWAFSATETVESANLMAGTFKGANLSPQEIVDCDSNDSGCNGGDPAEALQWVQNQGGLDTDSCYPYTAQDGSCASSQCSPSNTISGSGSAGSDEPTIYSGLQQYGPLSICCDAEPWQNYNGGIMTADECGDSIDHAIQLTGYSPSQGGYWIVRNSWGEDWGEDGFIWLQYGQDTCGITTEVTYATA